MEILNQIWLHLSDDNVAICYAQSLRTPIFSALFTLSSFLLATTTFVVTNMKKEVYDSTAYQNHIEQLRKANPKISMYGALKRLTNLLIGTVSGSFAVAVVQLTVGLVKANWAAYVCIVAASITMFLIFYVLYLVRSNIVAWIDHSKE